MIIALAGRRVDALGAEQPRFPSSPTNIAMVRERIGATLRTLGATMLVSSAACGADLLALSEAASLGLGRRVLLPFARQKFRATSVTDRPGDWGPLYDQILDQAEQNGEVLVIQPKSEDEAYLEVNHAIIDEAQSLAFRLHEPVRAIMVWDGKSRGAGDLTAEFGAYARSKGIAVIEVMTL